MKPFILLLTAVLLSKNFHACADDYKPQIASYYTVAYGGSDGVSVRSKPGGSEIIATAFKASEGKFLALSKNTTYANGLEWMPVRISGWMAKRNLRNGETNISLKEDGWGVVTWDGNGDAADNFVALRTLGDTSQRIAKIYYNTPIKLGLTRQDTQYEWVQASLYGWVAMKGPKGSALLSPITRADAMANSEAEASRNEPRPRPSYSSSDKVLGTVAVGVAAYLLYQWFNSSTPSSSSGNEDSRPSVDYWSFQEQREWQAQRAADEIKNSR